MPGMEQEIAPRAVTQGQARLTARLEQYGLPRAAIETLLSRHTLVRYPKGASLFGKGSPADVVFAVMSGMIKIFCSAGTERILIDLAGPGDLAGYADFSEIGGVRSQIFEAEALTATCVALFTRDHILRVLRGLDSGSLLAVTESINSLWAAMVYRCAGFLAMPLRARIESVLTDLAGRFGANDARGVMLTPELGQESLAEMIGGSRPMVSRLLMEMTEQGLIARDGRRYILLRAKWPRLEAAGVSPASTASAPLAAARNGRPLDGKQRGGTARASG
jgi:CRP-like cAMP-binding protein